MMRGPLAPTDRDASMNSRSFNDSTTPRTILATAIHPTADNNKTMKRTDVLSPMITLMNDISASTLRSTRSETRIGKARKMSVMRIKMSSSSPPR